MARIESQFDERITSERAVLQEYLRRNKVLPTRVRQLGLPLYPNPRSAEELGKYRDPGAKKLVTADFIGKLIDKRKIPAFLEAGPRERLFHSPQAVRVAIVTTGGLAPGLNCVLHGIVNRHWNTYNVSEAVGGGVFGIQESFLGLCNLKRYMIPLKPSDTEDSLDKGGSILGIRRHYPMKYEDRKKDRKYLATTIASQLVLNDINILYVIGGDGSLGVAHEIVTSLRSMKKDISVVGIPKTMDNDVMWVWQSFGFRTAVEKATEVINTMNWEAESTRRVCLIELFGAESGFVAANASLASGHVDLVLIPEEFHALKPQFYKLALNDYIQHLLQRVRRNVRPHAVVVLAEGVGKILHKERIRLGRQTIKDKHFVEQLKNFLQGKIKDADGLDVEVFDNQPRHNIRAIQANAQDQIYCERLGALAVDNAMAGYTDFMISQWLTEYVLVPLELVQDQNKRIPPAGIFWKQVVSSTGQPCVSNQRYESVRRE